MRKRKEAGNVEARLIGVEALCSYIGMGRTSAVKFAKAAGAERKIGRRSLYDVRFIDKAIDGLTQE